MPVMVKAVVPTRCRQAGLERLDASKTCIAPV